MKKLLSKIYKKQSLYYKIFLFISSVLLIVYLFPKGGKFKYDFQKGKVWQYETLYAPFDFAIYKSEEDLKSERESIISAKVDYFEVHQEVADEVKEEYDLRFAAYFTDSLLSKVQLDRLKRYGAEVLKSMYRHGVVQTDKNYKDNDLVNLITGNEQNAVLFDNLLQLRELQEFVQKSLQSYKVEDYTDSYINLFFGIVKPNVFYDEDFTKKVLDQELNNVVLTRGNVDKGKRIIAKGEVVEGEKYNMLTSLKREYQSQLWNEKNYNWIVLGYFITVSLALLMLFLFLKKYRPDVFKNNNKLTFIIFNVLLMIYLTTLVVKYDFSFVYVVPLCILPLMLKAFFDPRLGLFTHVLTVLILGFIVPNSFEYIFLQIIAGIVTIQTITDLHKRGNLFISVAQITFVYIVAYFGFYIIHEGNITNINWQNFGLFVLNGMATLAAFPLIYVYEKVFGLVSDVSLLELSDTNSKLLKELSNKAPGTFHHSLEVANLAEAACNEIGANAMLARVGALHHDIGKMKNAMYFTENQTTNVNPHDELSPEESAQIIINHVIDGIEIAKRNKLPDRVIDFIRTHHGTSVVYYFYKKEKEMNEMVNKKNFTYPGPIPFSKESAVLMMADAVEAASRSLKNPTYAMIDEFVEKIIDRQIEEGQFLNANITFKEIQQIKKVLKQKLTNIYHLRVEYPE